MKHYVLLTYPFFFLLFLASLTWLLLSDDLLIQISCVSSRFHRQQEQKPVIQEVDTITSGPGASGTQQGSTESLLGQKMTFPKELTMSKALIFSINYFFLFFLLIKTMRLQCKWSERKEQMLEKQFHSLRQIKVTSRKEQLLPRTNGCKNYYIAVGWLELGLFKEKQYYLLVDLPNFVLTHIFLNLWKCQSCSECAELTVISCVYL